MILNLATTMKPQIYKLSIKCKGILENLTNVFLDEDTFTITAETYSPNLRK